MEKGRRILTDTQFQHFNSYIFTTSKINWIMSASQIKNLTGMLSSFHHYHHFQQNENGISNKSVAYVIPLCILSFEFSVCSFVETFSFSFAHFLPLCLFSAWRALHFLRFLMNRLHQIRMRIVQSTTRTSPAQFSSNLMSIDSV